MIFAVVPPGRHHPAVLAVEVSLLWLRNRVLVPRVVLIDRIAQRVFFDEYFFALPVFVVGMSEQNPDTEVDLD